MVALCKYNFPIFHQEFDVTRDAKANLKNWNFEKKSCKPVWNFVTVFEKKNFFRDFSRNFEIPEVCKIRFSACSHRDRSILNSSNERGENLLSDDEKIWGVGVGTWSKITLKISAIFRTEKSVAFHDYHELS